MAISDMAKDICVFEKEQIKQILFKDELFSRALYLSEMVPLSLPVC